MTSLPFLDHPIDAVAFDCDSTLSHIEGIDELARFNDCLEDVARLTDIAMSQTGISPNLYKERLELIKPNQQQVMTLGNLYYQDRVQDAETVLALLMSLGKKVFILSAGLLPAVQEFGMRIGVSKNSIYAPDIYFDGHGQYSGFEESSPLISTEGKRDIIKDLMSCYPRIIHVGDGLNDVSAREVVTRFIGYGGVCYREKIAELSDYYITHSSLLTLLPFCLTQDEVSNLTHAQFELFQQGVKHLQSKEQPSCQKP